MVGRACKISTVLIIVPRSVSKKEMLTQRIAWENWNITELDRDTVYDMLLTERLE